MRKSETGNGKYKSGFTVIEMVVATMVSGIVVAAAMTAVVFAAKMVRAGNSQVEFNGAARLAAEKIVRYVEVGKAVSTVANGLDIMMVDFTFATIRFVDLDGDLDTVEDNTIRYDADGAGAGSAEILCKNVTPIDGEPMFAIIPSSRDVARVCFHVGDGSSIWHAFFTGTGQGYQGIQIRVSAAPRNLQMWYD
ncbi:MAG: prepilin-type N-terminal cleavage/methylation domain-containing protein [Lentisphaerae bacterium]|nr:prepilin-type N-terminal cleavage/methylation domain-containing protein [Lentisphaerota bacterium]